MSEQQSKKADRESALIIRREISKIISILNRDVSFFNSRSKLRYAKQLLADLLSMDRWWLSDEDEGTNHMNKNRSVTSPPLMCSIPVTDLAWICKALNTGAEYAREVAAKHVKDFGHSFPRHMRERQSIHNDIAAIEKWREYLEPYRSKALEQEAKARGLI